VKKLYVIVGPTAVGKTKIAIQLAKRLKCEIISCDSRQFYKEMSIGTAKPTPEELAEAPHHFINSHSIYDEYTAFSFEKDALNKIKELHNSNDNVIMVGGSGLFVRAVCEGIDDIPDVPTNLREEIKLELEQNGFESLLKELKEKDPLYYSQVEKQNPKRICRAIEVIRVSGKPFSHFRTSKKKSRPFKIVKIGLEMDRQKLYNRIDERMDVMIEEGLLNEARKLDKFKKLNALNTVGYKEIFDFLEEKYDWEEAVRLLKRNSRRYSKRQMTWFKKDEEIKWFDVETLHSINEII